MIKYIVFTILALLITGSSIFVYDVSVKPEPSIVDLGGEFPVVLNCVADCPSSNRHGLPLQFFEVNSNGWGSLGKINILWVQLLGNIILWYCLILVIYWLIRKVKNSQPDTI